MLLSDILNQSRAMAAQIGAEDIPQVKGGFPSFSGTDRKAAAVEPQKHFQGELARSYIDTSSMRDQIQQINVSVTTPIEVPTITNVDDFLKKHREDTILSALDDVRELLQNSFASSVDKMIQSEWKAHQNKLLDSIGATTTSRSPFPATPSTPHFASSPSVSRSFFQPTPSQPPTASPSRLTAPPDREHFFGRYLSGLIKKSELSRIPLALADAAASSRHSPHESSLYNAWELISVMLSDVDPHRLSPEKLSDTLRIKCIQYLEKQYRDHFSKKPATDFLGKSFT
ncbi:hypothetical protein GEMRC1_013424 [Eukaryota sp. GEM-RC1]